MSRGFALIKRIVLGAVALGGTVTAAHADDNSASRFGGDGYVYFHEDKPIVGNAISTFRRDNPSGLSVNEYQRLSSWSPVWQPAPAIDKTPATFRQTHPHGLAFSEYQARSSNSGMWTTESPSSAIASESTSPRHTSNASR